MRLSYLTDGKTDPKLFAIDRPWRSPIRLQPWARVELAIRKEDVGGKGGCLRFDGTCKDVRHEKRLDRRIVGQSDEMMASAWICDRLQGRRRPIDVVHSTGNLVSVGSGCTVSHP